MGKRTLSEDRRISRTRVRLFDASLEPNVFEDRARGRYSALMATLRRFGAEAPPGVASFFRLAIPMPHLVPDAAPLNPAATVISGETLDRHWDEIRTTPASLGLVA
jgi:hypothetical protein